MELGRKGIMAYIVRLTTPSECFGCSESPASAAHDVARDTFSLM